jgi:hypothetical protein
MQPASPYRRDLLESALERGRVILVLGARKLMEFEYGFRRCTTRAVASASIRGDACPQARRELKQKSPAAFVACHLT